MNAVLLTPALTHGDAVSNDVLGMAEVLSGMGYAVSLSVRWVTGDFPIVPINRIRSLLSRPDDLLVYHHSIGFAEGVELLENLPCRKIVKYHNITPPEFFQTLNRDIVRSCIEGREQLARIVRRADVRLCADSTYNADEIHAIDPGRRVEVVAPFHQVEHLLSAIPDQTSTGVLDDWNTNILMVGRLVPNKNISLALRGFSRYRHRYDPDSRLILVGDLGQEHYCEQILDELAELRLEKHVVLTGKTTLEQLRAIWLTSQMYLTTSLHEGFCLPLIEAMGQCVPIVAVPNAAIPGTAGDCAWYAQNTPESVADTLAACMADRPTRERRLVAGVERYAECFNLKAIAGQLKGVVGELVLCR